MTSLKPSAIALALLALALVPTGGADAQELYINEIFFDPGGAGLDSRDEFIEIRGTPNLSLADTYLIFIESEGSIDAGGTAGEIEHIFSFGDDPITEVVETPYTLGSNGYLTIRQKGNLYADPAPGTTDLVNTGTGVGFGSNTAADPTSSSIRAQDQDNDGFTENGGWSAWLIRDTSGTHAPYLGLDVDQGNDGLDDAASDVADWNDHWEIIDSIAQVEPNEAGFARFYSQVNFGYEYEGQAIPPFLGGPLCQPRIEPGAEYVGLGFEIEYLARWGDSTGQTAEDWHVSNITDSSLAGSAGAPDFRQSAAPHGEDDQFVESSQGVPYGAVLLDTLGSTNYFVEDGDADMDGDVDIADLMEWQKNFGYGVGPGLYFTSDTAPYDVTATRTHADFNSDRTVDGLDIAAWQAKFGTGSAAGALGVVPEPGALVLVALALPMLIGRRGR